MRTSNQSRNHFHTPPRTARTGLAIAAFAVVILASVTATPAADRALAWPEISRQQRPWAYCWIMGSAMDKTNVTRELSRYQAAGLGGIHIIPIYGAKGWESKYINYLSPEWMAMLAYTVGEANRLGLGVDMTTGTGWCFGGPRVTDDDANANAVASQYEVPPDGTLNEQLDRASLKALMAFGPDNRKLDLLPQVSAEGAIEWKAEGGPWRVFAISQKPSGQKVKRAAPGGTGHMLNLFYPQAMAHFLQWFDDAFSRYTGPKPRAQYHDSYEYRSNWAPDLFASFERRRGYRLQDELPALFGTVESDYAARVKCDYRETLSDIMVDTTLPMWVKWSHDNLFLTRNEAHGSPGNLLDLYGVADIPETEMFHLDRDKLASKFASSAAHVMGRPLISSETGTWLEEHFTETLADMKFLLDDLFLSGINHVFYHGTCYSPDEAAWPGWVFYASYEMNPRNSVWRDVPALNSYAARCQAILQSGRPDNDILLYWPIYDYWSSPTGLVQNLTVHGRGWFHGESIGRAAEWLWNNGYQFDYISDRQLESATGADGVVVVPGLAYRAVLVPQCQFMPVATLAKLIELAEGGTTVIFQEALPKDVPGWAQLETRRTEFSRLTQRARELAGAARPTLHIGTFERALAAASVPRETLLDREGLMCIRRMTDDGRVYFVANRGTNFIDDWVPLAVPAKAAALLDPLTGRTGIANVRLGRAGNGQVRLQLPPGASVFVRVLIKNVPGPKWEYAQSAGAPVALSGTWQVKFVQGGPEIPAPFETQRLASWTELGDTNAQRFAGAALYTLKFNAPGRAKSWGLDLGKVCQSARVRLNGRDLGTLITPPYQATVTGLKRRNNLLEIEVTNVSANRIRDLDRRGVPWKVFHDINFVNINYRPFDASNWPLTDSGLIGPVTLTPLR